MEAKKLITTKTVETTRTQYYTFAQPPDELTLESGEMLGPITLAYETYGELNPEKSNAILVLHALSGDAHAAGEDGWWSNLIGEGKGIDTDKYFVICSNILGGCRGSTGPSSINPKMGKPYGISFPLVTVGDMVNAQRHLVDHLGIKKLLAVTGGSMGGMQVLQWMTSYPKRIRAAIPIATTMKHTPQQIAFNEVGRQAVMADPDWRNGDYYSHGVPAKGLAIARMIGHITYMSDASMAEKFGRKFKSEKAAFKFGVDFEVEGYLRYRGDNFVKRFDANSYLYITKAIDYFNILNGHSLGDIFRGLQAKVLVLAFKSDWLYPAYQSQEIAKACKLAGVDASYCEVNSTYGHDAFLLETEQEASLISNFLNGVYNNGKEHSNDDAAR
ncbi:MAG: homoserine O-acetyltransferase [Candidatus Bathyarchaeia archaeon]|jgi:homoserine O-acetyltransferase